jgi:hypothetical protein
MPNSVMDRFMRKTRAAGSEQGYALVMVVFFAALVMITVSAATTTLLTQERREKEQEMIWRGQQYVRGIHLYYQKMHHFPMQLEDLYEPKTGIRFMRKAYKDPLNTADGSWRLIYVGPNGQIIGSLQQPALFPTQMTPPPQKPFTDSLSTPAPAANDPLSSSSTSSSLFSFSSSFSSSEGQGLSGGSAGNSQNSINGAATGSSGNGFGNGNSFNSGSSFGSGNTFSAGVSGANASSSASAQDPGTPQNIAQPLDSSSPVIGNAIIGVGSKVNKTSIIWYEKAKDYRHFEFIWKAWTQDPANVIPNP